MRIKQVVKTLLDNAIKYTEKGGITMTAKKYGEKVLISVSDTGVGLDKNDIEKAFQGFSRGTAGIDLFIEGTGLALYIAKKILELHRGRIWAESKGKGKGSTFYVELPIK